MCKTHRTQKYRAQRHSSYSFGDICRSFQPTHLKNHEFQFFAKLPTKPSSYVVVHRQPWPCAKIHRSQNFRAPRLSWYSFGAFGNLSNPHISKIMNFIFSQNSPPSLYLCRGAPTNLAKCKTHRTQNFRAPRLSWYSFGDIWRPFQPSYLKNHEFHFFTKVPTKASSYVAVHRLTWPSAKPSELKTFVHQDFHGIHFGAFGGQSNPHISKTTNFIFSQNCPPSLYLCRGAPTNLAKCKTHRTQNFCAPRLSWYSFGDIWRPFQASYLKNHEFHFFTKLPPSHLAMPWCTHQLGHVQNPPN